MPSIDSEPQAIKPKKDRSPSFPFISLKMVVDRLIAYEAKFGRHPTPASKVGLAWSMKPDSSQAGQTLAALKSFGFIDYAGSGEHRACSLTEEARNLLRAQQESVKAGILKAAVLRPKAFANYWSKWGRERPIDEVCLDELILKANFTDSAARTFLRVYDESLAFAKMADGDKVDRTDADEDSPLEEDEKTHITKPLAPQATKAFPKVGDLVQWESNGVIMVESARVRGLAPAGDFVFIEGSSTGLPMKEITVVAQGSTSTAPLPSAPVVGIRQDVFTLDEGTAMLQWPATLSSTSYEDFKDWIELQLRKIKRSIPDQQ